MTIQSLLNKEKAMLQYYKEHPTTAVFTGMQVVAILVGVIFVFAAIL